MCKGVVVVSARDLIENHMKETIPKERLLSIVKEKLVYHLSKEILENLESLPIEYLISEDVCADAETHMIRVNLISNKELRRIREIEKMYNDRSKDIYSMCGVSEELLNSNESLSVTAAQLQIDVFQKKMENKFY